MNHSRSPSRRGITLMEVLISLGILSVGLASVVALVPAGGSQAKLAVAEDRRAALGYAAMADAINRGILNPARWSAIPAVPYAVAIDPLGRDLPGPPPVPRFPGTIMPVDLAGIAPFSLDAEAVFRSADDVKYDTTQSEDDPAVPVYFPNAPTQRMSEGDFSWLATLLPDSAGVATQNYRLSVVCFYRRPIPPDLTSASPTTTFLGAQADPRSFNFLCALTDDDFRSLFAQGTAVLLSNAGATPTWRHVLMASPTRSGNTVTAVELMLDRPMPPSALATTLHAFQGAIGVTEKIVRLEGSSPWSQ
jgi:hypothetical protein